ncbi:MAG TPA: prepilin-type N-terminal cleavage/methylation domain-containing protein [Fimbriimonadaceae bacterium]|nr:prepilin-type N-terminal cleavage/methylation domain-containing protein [Fimbriimonadaceae bacterium]
MRNLRNSRLGFTLVELLIVIIVIAVLAAIAIPKFVNSSARSKEASLHADLKLCRDAVELFHNDTGAYPAVLTDLAATAAPANGKDSTGASYAITASNWKGPYLASVPNDPVASAALTYSITSPTVGQVNATASGNDSAGVPFSSY